MNRRFMRLSVVPAILGLALLVGVQAWPCRAGAEGRFEIDAAGGWRVEDFSWDIAGSPQGTDPNVLSELQWDDLELFLVQAAGDIEIPTDRLPFAGVLRARVAYGWIVDGRNRDSDYAGDNRTDEFSRSLNQADDGDLLEVDIALGPRFRSAGNALSISPLIGYAYREQQLTMTDGVQAIPDLGGFDGLDNTYTHVWKGPFAGLDLAWTAGERLLLKASAEYHWADFNAEANWNLRSDFDHPKSFEHGADGRGIVISLGAGVAISSRWSIDLTLTYQRWKARNGIDRVFFSDDTTATTRLNAVELRAAGLLVGVSCRLF